MPFRRATFVVGAVAAAAAPLAAQPRSYRFGVVPWQKDIALDDIRGRYRPLLEWLGHEVEASFTIVGGSDYHEVATLLGNGTIQMASISPQPFVEAQRLNPKIRMLATELSTNRESGKQLDSYTGYILALKSRADITGLQDLRGKRFAFVVKDSTSGYVVPNYLLRKAGIDYTTYFERVTFLGSHPFVTDAIAAGSVDAGATWDFNWNEAVKKHGDIFKSILTSPPIPNVGIAAHPDMPAATQEKIRAALVRVDPKLLQGLPATGYVAKPDSFYDWIRQIDARG